MLRSKGLCDIAARSKPCFYSFNTLPNSRCCDCLVLQSKLRSFVRTSRKFCTLPAKCKVLHQPWQKLRVANLLNGKEEFPFLWLQLHLCLPSLICPTHAAPCICSVTTQCATASTDNSCWTTAQSTSMATSVSQKASSASSLQRMSGPGHCRVQHGGKCPDKRQ